MKKIPILLLFLTAGFASTAQTNNATSPAKTETKENIYTSLKPADGQVVVFHSKEEMEAKVEGKKENMREFIRQNANDPERVKYYREELWRFENAVVKQDNK